jgi:mRNA-degrading endonuclease RelE of RelBE toxin-antitoxin system
MLGYASAKLDAGGCRRPGKRGGYRVIYYLKRVDGVIWMLTMYPKNVIEDIAAHVLRQIREEIENG